jgi:hypothetical protein
MTRDDLLKWAQDALVRSPEMDPVSGRVHDRDLAAAILALDVERKVAEAKLTAGQAGRARIGTCECNKSHACCFDEWQAAEARKYALLRHLEEAHGCRDGAAVVADGRPPLAPAGCGQIGPRGLRCEAHVSGEHISYKRTSSAEVADWWPLASGAGKTP